VLLLVTYRDDGPVADSQLLETLGDVASQRTVRRLAVPPLTPAAVATLAPGSSIDPTALYELTAGNPYYVTELLAYPDDELPVTAREAVHTASSPTTCST
jgi:hypothetical protein